MNPFISSPTILSPTSPKECLQARLSVKRLLTELNQEGTTVVMVTHSKRDASYAHRIVHLFDGSVVANIVE